MQEVKLPQEVLRMFSGFHLLLRQLQMRGLSQLQCKQILVWPTCSYNQRTWQPGSLPVFAETHLRLLRSDVQPACMSSGQITNLSLNCMHQEHHDPKPNAYECRQTILDSEQLRLLLAQHRSTHKASVRWRHILSIITLPRSPD